MPQIPVNAFIIDPANSNNLFAGTDIGVYGSTNGGTTWLPYGTGLPRVAVFDMAITGLPAKVLRIATHGRGMWQNSLVAATSDLAITKTDGVATYTPGGTTTYTITASNAGPDNVIGATVADTYPAALTTVNWTAVYAGGATGPAAGSGNINVLINIPSGGSATFTAVCNISPAATGNLINTATITAPVGTTDPNLANNIATDTDTPTPTANLAITKTDGVTTYTPGGSTTYTIVASNAGPSNVIGATVADTYPAAIISANWTAVFAGGASGTAAGSGNLNQLVNIPVGGSVTYTVVCTISGAASGNLTNTATVSSATTDPVPANNSATDINTQAPVASADLSITKTDGVATYTPGGSVTYTIVASNAGPDPVIGATVADVFPAAITAVSWTATYAGGGTGPAAGAGNINALVDLPVGGSATFTAICTISGAASGTLTNTATVSSATADPTPGNNSATDIDAQAGGGGGGVGVVLSEVEPNNTFATATPITSPSKVQGNVFPNADADWYSFTANAGEKVYAAVITSFSANGSSDSQLRLFASDGTTLIEFDDDDGSLGGLSSSMAGATIPSSGTYYLQVVHFLATGQLRGYDLYLKVQSGTPTPEVESNDTPATANAMPANGWVSGARNPALATEQDWYSVTLAAGESVFISMDLDPERDNFQYDGRLGFALFGDANNQVLVVNDASTGSVANPLSEMFVFTAKDAGTYYVFADAASAATGGPTATYNISYTKFPAQTGYVNTPSTDVPKAIGPATGSVTSTITVPGNPRIKDLSVRITLNHALMGDIDAILTSPGGNTIHLFTDIGSTATGGQTQMDLFFNDNNAIPPTFTVLRPVGIQPELSGKLNQFKNMNGGGIWTLTLYDDGANVSGGSLTAWSLDILEDNTPDVSSATVLFSTDFESGAAGFTHSGTADEWELGTPATIATTTANPIAGFTTANSGVNCWKTDLDNTYDASSNQTLQSPSIALPATADPLWLSWAMKYQMEGANLDQLKVTVQQVGNPASAKTLFEWLGATQTATVGNPTVNVPQSAGWGTWFADVSSFAGQNIEFLVNLTSETSINLGGVAIDDVTVYQISSCTPASITLGASPDVCSGSTSANLPYTATTGSPDQYSIDYDAAAELAGFVDVVNAALPASPIVLTVPAAAPVAVYNATITVINSVGGCVNANVPFTVTVSSAPSATISYTGTPYCQNGGTAAVTQTGTPGGTYSAAPAGLTINPGTGAVTLGTSTPGAYTVTYTIAASGSCPSFMTTASITVNAVPVGSASPQAICSGATTSVTLNSTIVGTTYSYTAAIQTTPTGGTITGHSGGTANPIAQTLTNTGTTAGVIRYTVTPSANGCTGSTFTVDVTVNPTPNAIATPSSQNICNATAITPIVLTSGVAGTTFAWVRDNNATVTGIAANGSGTPITGTLTNTTNAPVTVTFTITPTANSCPGTPITVTVTVAPTPTVDQPANQTVCVGTMTAPVVFTSPVAGVTYNWTNSNTAIGLGASGTGNIPAFTGTNATTLPITGTITVTPSFAGGPSVPVPVTFTNTTSMLVPAGQPGTTSGPAAPYPSTIAVSGLPTTGVAVQSVTLTNISHSWGSDVDVLLVGPGGQKFVLMSDVSGSNGLDAAVTLTLQDGSPSLPSANIAIASGTYAPTSIGAPTSTWLAPAPAAPYNFPAPAGASTFASVFNTTTDYNGTWNLYVMDDLGGDFGNITGGWSITLASTLPGSCAGPSKTFNITVNPTPTITCPANITTASDVGVCNKTVNYTPTVTGTPAPTLSYVLTGATTGSGAGSGSGLKFNVGVTTVTITATNICATVTCSFTITVTDSQLPVINTQPANRTVCAGSNATFTVAAVTAPSAGGPLSYQWQLWNGSTWNNIAGATAATLTLNSVTQTMNTNSYRVQVIGLCTTITSGFATLYVNPLPTINLTTSIPPALLPTQVLTITATTAPSGGNYVWFKNGVVIAGATGNTLAGLTVSDIGTYRVVYTDGNGCVATSANIDITGQPSDNLYVYPVPNQGVFNVRFYNQANEQVTVRVFDAKGAEVYSRKVLTTIPYTTINVDLSTSRLLANGTYVVDVRGADGRLMGSRKIIVYNR
ncbi:MAG: DUF11 domain-containing protein [Chitinophagaceae bacterium]|nr:DUF11 domain-containing protein [Chitinophagaceae bacterium]